MRPMYVSVRLAATVMAVAAAAGCMSVGEDGGGGSARPSRSAERHGGEAPDGGSGVSGRGAGGEVALDGKHGGGEGRGKGGESASPSVSPSAGADRSAPATGGPGRPGRPGVSTSSRVTPTPSRPADPPSTPSEPPASASPEPTVAEPSSSAHQETVPQLAEREPAPAAGAPA
ncbi:hypothetical protein OHN38_19060 [Streptomyces sp. NBC_00588]|nr:hypothetical protein OHN38_19060 [Streptomyces sp. NBC_00588]